MDCLRKPLVILLTTLLLMPGGCQGFKRDGFQAAAPDGAYEQMATEIEFPAESLATASNADESLAAPPPWTITSQEPPEYEDISLEEVIRIALCNSRVLHDLGGAVVRAPGTQRTDWDPAIAETDPQYGTEAALSAFDAQFSTSLFSEKNDRALNNEFFGGGTRVLDQDASVFQTQITKRAATGSEFTIRHNIDYDANNAPGNLFPSAWNANVETEIRQPLLQGSGLEFNRIAGPSTTPGIYNGVLVARTNTDIALADFEVGVRDLVSNLENAYWDLYYGYRDLDTKIAARDSALDTWRKIYALYESGRRGGEAEKEGQAREQYFRFQEEVQNALSGQLIDGTRTGNGSGGGTFRGVGGVLVAERRLRLLMSLPPSGGKLLRPSDEPILAPVTFDWQQVADDAATRRAELRRQKWVIRRRELELIASKNYLLPRLDAVGLYRWRGFGHDLLDNHGTLGEFDNAYGDLTSGNFQEWQLGFELTVPIGFRLAHTAVSNAEMRLARARAILRDQQREVIHESADAIAEMNRAYAVSQTSFNRLVASRQQLGAVQAAYDADKAPLDLLLDAQRRYAEAESGYYRTLAEFVVATKNVHYVKGTLLEYDGVYLAEGGWPAKAYQDAAKRESMRGPAMPLNYASKQAEIVGVGTYPQVRTDSPYSVLNVEPLSAPSPADSSAPAPVPADTLPPPEKSQLPPQKASAGEKASEPKLSPAAGAATTPSNPFLPAAFEQPAESADERPTAAPAHDKPLARLPPPSL
jgi:Outer membrane efflux protein